MKIKTYKFCCTAYNHKLSIIHITIQMWLYCMSLAKAPNFSMPCTCNIFLLERFDHILQISFSILCLLGWFLQQTCMPLTHGNILVGICIHLKFGKVTWMNNPWLWCMLITYIYLLHLFFLRNSHVRNHHVSLMNFIIKTSHSFCMIF